MQNHNRWYEQLVSHLKVNYEMLHMMSLLLMFCLKKPKATFKFSYLIKFAHSSQPTYSIFTKLVDVWLRRGLSCVSAQPVPLVYV